jgi:hypothetical protein
LLVLEIPIGSDEWWRTECRQMVLISAGLLGGSVGSYIPAAMMKGRIAIPDVDIKTWRSRGGKRTRTQPALASAIVTPAPMKKPRLSVAKQQMPTDSHE